VIRQLRSETAKVTTTTTTVGLLAALAGLVVLAVVVHVYALPDDQLANGDSQRQLLTDIGINLGGLFAALIGALSVTTEFRTGTIRPTVLASPRRARVIAAKAVVSAGAGALAVLVSVGTASVAARVTLSVRDLASTPSAGDYVELLAGGAVAGGLLGVIGTAVGAIIRAQVPTFVALFIWLLFIENVLVELPGVHRFVPGALAQGIAGQSREGVLQDIWLAALVLCAYALGALFFSVDATRRRDIA
jgi:ABC-type transport system involved in multi-copper enzyme maturation permease subunit